MKNLIFNTLRAARVMTTLAASLHGTATLAVAQEQRHSAVESIASLTPNATSLDRASKTPADSLKSDSELVQIAQVAGLWCYTDAGAFPMAIIRPVGASCTVRVPYPPYLLVGYVGF
jgi:hypothetical protein